MAGERVFRTTQGQIAPFRADGAEILQRVRGRAELVATAEGIVGKGARLDAVEDVSLMRVVVRARKPELSGKLDAGSDTYVRELYRIVQEEAARSATGR